MLKGSEIIEKLSRSQIYQDYEEAFTDATELPLALRQVEIWQHSIHGKKNENPFCALMAKTSRSCAGCLQVQHELNGNDPAQSKSVTCFAGLCDTAVPVALGQKIIGYLQTGQVAINQPTKESFSKLSQQLVEWGVKVDLGQLEDAYFHSRVLTREQYEGMIRLLIIFSKHLSVIANQLMVEQQNQEPPMIARARKYINEHQQEPLSLEQIAKSLNVSTFYFCKMFKKATGLTFTDYLNRTRVERAKNLLMNPNVRVSEAAYDCGFVSLTHFNRIFKRVVGRSPTDFRREHH